MKSWMNLETCSRGKFSFQGVLGASWGSTNIYGENEELGKDFRESKEEEFSVFDTS
jgi:hypothetical protein